MKFHVENDFLIEYLGHEKHVDVPEEVIGIDRYAFADSKIESVHIPQEVFGISSQAFIHCDELKEVVIDGDGEMLIQWQAFGGCGKLEKITLHRRLDRIRRETFLQCRRLRSIRVPDGVRRIGPRAFDGCEALEEVILPEGLEEICDRAFSDCRALRRIVIPDSVHYIGEHAFSRCSALEQVHLPEALDALGDLAFFCCALRGEIRIPKNTRRISNSCFTACRNLAKISYPASCDIRRDEDIRGDSKRGGITTGLGHIFFYENNAENVNDFETPFVGCNQAIVEAY